MKFPCPRLFTQQKQTQNSICTLEFSIRAIIVYLEYSISTPTTTTTNNPVQQSVNIKFLRSYLCSFLYSILNFTILSPHSQLRFFNPNRKSEASPQIKPIEATHKRHKKQIRGKIETPRTGELTTDRRGD